MHRTVLATVTFAAACVLVSTAPARAQDDQPPPTRYVVATSFDVPFQDRGELMPWLTEYFLPGYQLHPEVVNFRMLVHNWGSDASTIVFVAEYEEFADIEAECGQPCDDYFEQHEEPEEGDEGYEEYQRRLGLFQKYFSKHRDEIYTTNMNRAIVEGQMQGPVGPTAEEE